MEPVVNAPGGLTINDALGEFEARGYVGQFVVTKEGRVECIQCGERYAPRQVHLEAMRRLEGASDPADMVFVGAVRCPGCGQAGTTVLNYGAQTPPGEAEVLRALDDHRAAHLGSHDHSLVRDSGWLLGPDG